ncbi:hypothetical protein [Cytobacillus oceanisediminis]|uniref:hypothetical protein n=1 Tax=Cytobacillus oceanisediminis TaxID=665099 RepID=UPI0011A1BF5A|nr:hypothetical protein [Cytobacillus oceanisediminis]
MMSINEQLGEVEEKAYMLNVLSRISSSLLMDEEYSKNAAAKDLIKFMNSQVKTFPCISENIGD